MEAVDSTFKRDKQGILQTIWVHLLSRNMCIVAIIIIMMDLCVCASALLTVDRVFLPTVMMPEIPLQAAQWIMNIRLFATLGMTQIHPLSFK